MRESSTTLNTDCDANPCVADLSVGLLRDVVGGRLRHGDLPAVDGDCTSVGRIVRDASAIERGDVFWAKDGTQGDRCASEFAYEALMRGAAGVVAHCPVEPWSGRWSLHVADTSRALSKLAEWNRARFTGRTIGVTGSVGKSTTLAMIEAVLRSRLTGTSYDGRKESGVREEIVRGVLGLDPLDDFALFELPGDSLDQTSGVCRPEVAVVTNLADAQWTALARRMAAFDDHRELLAELPAGGVAVLPGDDLWVRRLAAGSGAPIVWFGRGGDCDIRATDVECRGESLRFSVEGVRIAVPVWGRHLLDCALAAYAVGRFMNFLPHEIAEALGEFRPLPHRCSVLGVGGRGSEVRKISGRSAGTSVSIAAHGRGRRISVIDDSQGHSPAATRAALQLLRDFDASGRRLAVLGDVAGSAIEVDKQVGEQVVSLCGADMLIACGDRADELVESALEAGMPARRAVSVREAGEAASVLNHELESGDVVLVHGRARFPVSQLFDQIGAEVETRAA